MKIEELAVVKAFTELEACHAIEGPNALDKKASRTLARSEALIVSL